MGDIREITGLKEVESMNAFERPDARTANTDCRAIPVVDLGPLIRGEKDAIEKITAPWRDACENLGFLCVSKSWC